MILFLKMIQERKWITIIFIVFLLLQPTSYQALSQPTTVNSKKQEIKELQDELLGLQDGIHQTGEAKIALETRLEVVKNQIAETRFKLVRLKKALEEQETITSGRLRALYKKGSWGYIEVLLRAQSFYDFLSRLIFISRLHEQDEKIWQELDEKRKKIEELTAQLVEEEKGQSYLLRAYQKNLAELLDKQNRLKEMLKNANEELKTLIALEEARYKQSRTTAAENSYLGEVAAVEARVEPDGLSYITSFRFPQVYQSTGEVFYANASWYGPGFHGQNTASGEIYNQNDFTCAHWDPPNNLPFNTYLALTYNGRRIIVKVNDRGPFIPGRQLDLSKRAAEELGYSGVAYVRAEIVVPLP